MAETPIRVEAAYVAALVAAEEAYQRSALSAGPGNVPAIRVAESQERADRRAALETYQARLDGRQ